MPKTKISEFDVDPANNTDINSINIAEGCAPSGINNAIRQLMSDLKAFQTGADGDPFNGAVNGTVGATTPASGAFTSLSASGAFSANGGATLGDASGDALTINSSAVSIPNGLNFDSNTFVIDATNNRVGVGTASPSDTLDINGTTIFRFGGTQFGAVFNDSSALNLQAGSGSTAGLKIGTSAATPLIFYTNGGGNERMRIASGGAVGIGTSSPAYLLDISQTATSTINARVVNPSTGVNAYAQFRVEGDGGYGYMGVSGTGNSVSGSAFDGDSMYVGADSSLANGLNIAAVAAAPIKFFTNGSSSASQRMIITSAGNVGIGTSSPATQLQVSSSTGSTLRIENTNTGLTTGSLVGGLEFYSNDSSSGGTGVAGYLKTVSTGSFGNIFNTVLGVSSGNANNYLSFETNATERMRLDSSGNLGLGVTPSAWNSGYKALQIGSKGALYEAGPTGLANNFYVDSGGTNRYITTAAASAYLIDSQHRWFTAPSGTAGNAITFTQAMTLDASGNLGIGTTSPSRRLHVVDSGSFVANFQSTGTGIYTAWQASGGTVGYIGGAAGLGAGSATDFGIRSETNMIFMTNAGSERMRIDSSGNLLVAGTANPNSGKVAVNVANSGRFMSFINNSNSAEIGYIQNNSGTAVIYSTSSDYRLKENIAPMVGALEKVKALKPVTYTWKSTGNEGQGFIAHELQQVCPDAVCGTKDEVDAEGNPVYQGIDTSFLVATLTASIQELKAIVDAQAERIAVLESK